MDEGADVTCDGAVGDAVWAGFALGDARILACVLVVDVSA